MNTLYFHYFWSVCLFCLFLVFSLLSMFVSYDFISIYISFPIFSIAIFPLEVSFYLDFISLWFTTVILLISCIVIVYSYNYMIPYSNGIYFLWMTVLFVVAIIVVVVIPNLFFIMLGWDGLGLVSFFLIVFYQNNSSITSGIFTLLINRIGDCFFLVSIVIFFYYHYDLTFLSPSPLSTFMCSMLLITFMTNSAIFPFSSWLPLAMAAPTPISALVHSSTLVTAGLYLMIRFSVFFYSSFFLINLLLVLSLFTSFYAGINSIFEVDLNKLIALSTLSHLGFICIAFSCGLVHLSYFHLLTHALFKSLLFMGIGDIMTNLNHSQDIRFLSSGALYTPFSVLIIQVSLLNLLGLPSLSGYFSKDLILEIAIYSNLSICVVFIIFLNVFFTYYYTYRLFSYSFSSDKTYPYKTPHVLTTLHSLLLCILSFFTLFFGYLFMDFLCPLLVFIDTPSLFNFIPHFINITVLSFLILSLNLFVFTNQSCVNYFSNIMFLSSVCMPLMSNLYYSLSFSFSNSLELGVLNYTLNYYFPSRVTNFSLIIFRLISLNPINITLWSIPFTFLMYILFLLNNIIHYVRLLLAIFLVWI